MGARLPEQALRLSFAFVLLCCWFPHLPPPRECCQPAGITELLCRLPVPQRLALVPGIFILVVLVRFHVGMGGQPHLDTSPRVRWMKWLVCWCIVHSYPIPTASLLGIRFIWISLDQTPGINIQRSVSCVMENSSPETSARFLFISVTINKEKLKIFNLINSSLCVWGWRRSNFKFHKLHYGSIYILKCDIMEMYSNDTTYHVLSVSSVSNIWFLILMCELGCFYCRQ